MKPVTSDIDPDCLLYLIVEANEGSATQQALHAALSAGPVTSVLITPLPDTSLNEQLVRPLVAACQDDDVVVLIAGDAALAKQVGADGVHISWREDVVAAFQEARNTLGHDAVIGGDAGRSRHTAMELGEAGADYVAFGIPSHVKDRETAENRQRELIAWWAEIFEPACVAFTSNTPDLAAIGNLVEDGADFVSVTIKPGQTADDISNYIRDVLQTLEQHSEIRNAALAEAETSAGAKT
ncbi:MAG: thiamine phosphate synthase [Hyphomicrobiaceae bacterium]